MRKFIYLFILLLMLQSCYKGKRVDLIIHNARVHVMNDQLKIADAIAIKDGKIVEVGAERQILNKYSADQTIDAQSKDVFPGFHDCHGHIISLAKQMLHVDLRKTHSYYQVIGKLEKHKEKTHQKILIGRGWDQSLWEDKTLPSNGLLNKNFPRTPVAITRIDGHAMLINQAMMDYIGITDTTSIAGGKFIKKDGKLTGLLLNHALDVVNKNLPQPTNKELKENILKIQNQLLAAGVTMVDEAGLTARQRDIFIQLSKDSLLKINVYAMLFPTPKNIAFAKKHGHYRSYHLSIRSFKVIADGALGSRGACMLSPYSDDSTTYGMMLKTPKEIGRIAEIAKKLDYQLNVHCIGDSANRVMLNITDTLMKGIKDHRWRIEHAQIINPKDFKLFATSGIIPSVQPTHATDDYRWAAKRIGEKRLKEGGYAYKTLHEKAGMLLFGSDFPVESYNPFATIYAATHRKNTQNEPENGFLTNEAVSTNVALKAMTLWASFGCFQENEIGTLEKGKKADLIILDQPFENTETYQPNYAWITLMDGKTVFDMR